MNRALLAGVTTIMALSIAGQAFAQAAKLAPEQRSKIKEYVLNAKGGPFTIIDRPWVGGKLSANVQLTPVPTDWGPSLAKFRYVLTPVPTNWSPSFTTYSVAPGNNQVVLVEPSTREVVEIVKQ